VIGVEKGLESLKVWQKAMSFVEKLYQEVLPLLPENEKYAMTSQLRRALISIPSNIAEGHGRYYFREGVRFCLIARGSIEEVRTLLHLAHRFGYLKIEDFTRYITNLEEIRRMLIGYINYLQDNLEKDNPAHKIKDDADLYELKNDPYDL
jgi:four helix bundle protein